MMKHFKHLGLLLFAATLACAEPPQAKPNVRPAQSNSPAVEQLSTKTDAKSTSGRSAPDGNTAEAARPSAATQTPSVEIKYNVQQMDSASKENAAWIPPSSGDLTVIIVGFFISALFLWWLIRYLKRDKVSQSVASRATVSMPDANQLNQSINTISVRLTAVATSSALASAQTSINANIASLGNSLVPKIAEAAIAAMAKSELGDLRQKLSNASSELEKAKKDLESRNTQFESASEKQRNSEKNLILVENEKATLGQKLLLVEGDNLRLKNELDAAQNLVTATQADADTHKAAADRLRVEASKSFDVLAPAKLRETGLFVQMQALYQESLAGNAASIAAWTTLTTFVSAQADPSAKDFQLQIVRRLGMTLVSYWKHQGLSEKDRHDQLVHWAKSLNEHADGRFNLLVPSLGEPVDRSRMSCTASVSAIREVLCWQVRNPAGANFSLAEVA